MVANGMGHQYMINTLQHNNGDGTGETSDFDFDNELALSLIHI